MATVPFQTTPTEQIRVGSAPQLSATEVRPMDDTVTDDMDRSAKAFNQFAQIAKGLQDERDDAHSKELHTEYQTRALEIENDYLSTELGNAIKVVGYEDDGTTPITAYDQKVKDLNALKEEIAERTENKNQLAIFNEKSSATILSSTNRMSKHSIAEGSKHANNEAIADIDNSITETGLSVDDFNMGENSEYVKNLLALDVKIKNYAESKGIEYAGDSQGNTEDSETYINIRNGYLNKVHDASITKLLLNNEYRKAAEYLEFHEKNGTIAEAQINKHMKTIQTGLNKENGETIANNIIDGKNINSNDGGFTSSAQVITSLEGSNNATNSNGLEHVEGNTKEINIQNLEKLQKESKYYKEGATVSLPPEHRTTHLFLTKELGVKKADSLFSKGKKLLLEEGFVIDTEKLKNDPEGYGVEVNTKIMEKVVSLAKLELLEKYGPGADLDLYSKDLDTVVSKIDYTYKNTQQPSIRVGEDGVFNLEDALVFARENVKNPSVLEYVEANLKAKHTELTEFAEENYKTEILGPAEELAYAEPGGWKNIKPEIWEQLKIEDKENLQKGFSKTNDRDTLIDIETGKINIFDKKAPNYQSLESLRYLMTEAKYEEFALEVAGVKSGSGSGSSLSGSVTVDTDMFDKNLANYKFETKVDLLKNKGKEGDDYLDIKNALKKEIFKFEKENGVKPNYEQKEALLQEILADKVFLAGKGRFRPIPIDAVDLKDQKKVYVRVGGKRIFMKDIPDAQEELMVEAILKTGLPVTQQRIAEYWVEAGKPKGDTKVDATQSIGEIKGPTYGMMAG